MSDVTEDVFEGIDDSLLVELLPDRVREAELLLANTALILYALRRNPHADREELSLTEKAYLARKFQLTELRALFNQKIR